MKSILRSLYRAALRALERAAHRLGVNYARAGDFYSPLPQIRRISLAIAVAVAERAYEMKLARKRRPADLRKSIAALMYQP